MAFIIWIDLRETGSTFQSPSIIYIVVEWMYSVTSTCLHPEKNILYPVAFGKKNMAYRNMSVKDNETNLNNKEMALRSKQFLNM